MGWTLVPEGGAIRVDGYSSSAISLGAGPLGQIRGTDGDVSGSIYRYIDTAPGRFQGNIADRGGLNFYCGLNAGVMTSDWLWDGSALTRFISGSAATYLYRGGTQHIAPLDVTISYGPAAPPLFQAAPAAPVAAVRGEARGSVLGSFATGVWNTVAALHDLGKDLAIVTTPAVGLVAAFLDPDHAAGAPGRIYQRGRSMVDIRAHLSRFARAHDAGVINGDWGPAAEIVGETVVGGVVLRGLADR
jgi:hypothetical protein